MRFMLSPALSKQDGETGKGGGTEILAGGSVVGG